MKDILKSRIVGIIQARMGSSRLVGKTLIKIAGRPLLGHVIDRVRASHRISDIVVATTLAEEDKAIVDFARANTVFSYEGSGNDVLDRFYGAACLRDAEIIVRITADDPFKDPAVIDLVVDAFLAEPSVDYASNTLEPTFPEGLDVEVFTMSALETAWKQAELASEREHVTPYLWKHPERFRLRSVRNTVDLSRLRWTLDYEEDLQFTSEVYARLYRGQVFGMQSILSLLEREPNLAAINTGIVRNAAYLSMVNKESSS